MKLNILVSKETEVDKDCADKLVLTTPYFKFYQQIFLVKPAGKFKFHKPKSL